jgi:prepilin-type N-terminal cleavage/methylation domain-containing protein
MNRHLRAFTLIEILMVIVIIGIAAAIIVPEMSQRDDLKAAAAARIVMSDLMYTQNLAITRQRTHYLAFDQTNAANPSYKLVNGTSMSTAIQHPVSQAPYLMTFGPGGDAGLESAMLESVDFKGAGATSRMVIGFDELGTPVVYIDASSADESLSSGSVVVKSGLYKLRISVEPYTGQLTVAKTN